MHLAVIVITFALVQIGASYLSGILATGDHLSLQYLPLVALAALATFGTDRYLATVRKQQPTVWKPAAWYLTGLTLGAALGVLIHTKNGDLTETDIVWSVFVEVVRLVIAALSMLLALLVARRFWKRSA